jgi:adenosylmethionine-8-amino-7-oxononanoate aminotransferase
MTDSKLWHPFADMSAVRHDEFVVARGEDVWIFDEQGNRYLDATASLWYANVGHGRAEIIAAIGEQLHRLEAYSAFGDFANRPALELAERLSELAPGDGWRVFLGSGGGDGIDTAAKLARRYFAAVGQPQRQHLITRSQGYHGTHGWGTALAGIPANIEGFGAPLAESVRVEHSSLDALSDAFEQIGPERVAAVIAEPVIGAGGVYPPAPGYLEGASELCRRHGALFISDSVICGFGRLGNWFGIERFGVRPDLIVFAKGVTSGYLPLGGVMVSGTVAEPFFTPGGPVFRHGPTYAGHATCCAAALANLDVLGRDGLLQRGRELEGDLLAAVRAVADHPLVASVRGGVGLLAAVELAPETPDIVQRVFRATRARGVIIRPLGTSVAVSPPLTVTHEHLELLARSLRGGLDDVAESLGTAPSATAATP